jgi:hypothetical protein
MEARFPPRRRPDREGLSEIGTMAGLRLLITAQEEFRAAAQAGGRRRPAERGAAPGATLDAMVAKTAKERFDRRAMRGRSRWRLAWPGIAGCAVLAFDTAGLLCDPRLRYGTTWGMVIGPGLLLCALGCTFAAVSEPPRMRRPALLMNGAFLLAAIAYVALRAMP